MLLLALLACHRPPPAPADLDELMAWMFAHAEDEDPAGLGEASDNLSIWLGDHLEDTLEGYEVLDLDSETTEALGQGEVDAEGLVGAAVGHVSEFPADGLGGVNAIPRGTDLSDPGTEGQGRVYRTDPACFAARTCDWLESEEWAHDELPLGVVADTHWYQNWRWVDTAAGPGMLQRWWTLEPIDFNVGFLDVEHQFYLWVFLPWEDGTSVNVQATWIQATLTGAPVPENVALNMVVDEMKDTATRLDERYAAP